MKTELILPAGNLEKLEIAIAYGADAVYAGIPLFSLRARENQFTIDDVRQAIEYAHAQGKRIYLTCNIFARNNKLAAFEKTMEQLVALKPDAFIMADIGLISIVRERWPEVEIHLSTQANVTNAAQVKFYRSLGIRHVVLARELSLSEIRVIHQEAPDVTLEAFVHGAMCFAYSGRCMISNYLTGRDSNQGICSQSCRWKYRVLALEEETRPGETMPIEEDEHGTYFFNSRDLCMINHLDEMIDAGITHFKIEGRSKTEYYAGVVARAYRRALDALAHGTKIPAEELMAELSTIATRGFTTGLYFGSLGAGNQNYNKNESTQSAKYLGIVRSFDPHTSLARITVKNQFRKGDTCEIVTPSGTLSHRIASIRSLAGEQREEAHGGAEDVLLHLTADPGPNALLRKRISFHHGSSRQARSDSIND